MQKFLHRSNQICTLYTSPNLISKYNSCQLQELEYLISNITEIKSLITTVCIPLAIIMYSYNSILELNFSPNVISSHKLCETVVEDEWHL